MELQLLEPLSLLIKRLGLKKLKKFLVQTKKTQNNTLQLKFENSKGQTNTLAYQIVFHFIQFSQYSVFENLIIYTRL